MFKAWIVAACVASMPLFAVGCGGDEPKSAEDAKGDKSPMDELKAIPVDLTKESDDIMKPITDVDSVIETLEKPEKVGLDKKSLQKVAKTVFDGGDPADVKVKPEHQAEYNAFVAKVKGIGPGLKAIPEKVAAFTPKLVETMAKVPVLAGKATVSLQATAANPFGNKDEIAKAKADLKDLDKTKTEISAKIDEIKKRVMGLPAKATEASTKFSVAITAN
jgi:hypothetical protein